MKEFAEKSGVFMPQTGKAEKAMEIEGKREVNKDGEGVPMKLDPEGKKRLESMKKTLAAGLPLAGLLAASAMVVPEALAGSVMELNGGDGLALKLTPDGHLVTEDGTPVVIVDVQTEETGEIVDRVRVFPGYLSGGPPSDPSEDSAEEE